MVQDMTTPQGGSQKSKVKSQKSKVLNPLATNETNTSFLLRVPCSLFLVPYSLLRVPYSLCFLGDMSTPQGGSQKSKVKSIKPPRNE